MDFDKSNDDWVRFYDKLVRPLTAGGVTVLLLDNVGHADEAKRRAKGASAKSDRADLTFSCALCAEPVGLLIKAHKVRSVRAGFQRGDEWLFLKDTQRIEQRGTADRPVFRPTKIMQRVSEAIEADEGLTRNAIRTAVGGRAEYVTLALELLASEGYVAADRDGQALHHRSVKPYREDTESTGSIPSPHQVPDPVQATESTESPLRSRGLGTDSGSSNNGSVHRVPDLDVDAEVHRVAALSDEVEQERAWQELEHKMGATT